MTALRNPKNALLAALACLAGLTVTGIFAYLVPIAQARDSATLRGFVALNRPRVTELIAHVAHLADPRPYAVIGLTLAGVAFCRRKGRVGVAIIFLLFLTGATTQTLKQGLAQPRFSDWLGNGQIAAASWPSGHATASMTLAFCAVLAAPPIARPTVAAVGALFAVSVSYSILALGWHFPSDVIGGFFVASMWTALAVAILEALPDRRADADAGARPTPRLPVPVPRGSTVRSAFGPMVIGSGAVTTVAAAWLARPEAATTFARERPWFVLGALTIAAMATALAAGLARGVDA
ncbi:phosphatase PAP2 family protein [Paraconexibacter antarcticus]|uniref:Phosphatase PAP2 family protein n=1 Tax=Paraconexibacter antarcticus TaxID=2949664 RepID=A0ABY5DQ53_9ACTN|nr:phosphatase PAP2 family protein [Paraconexibacter antarcticus]UTI63202.1 phosphatase PAP2 family protein [Paraconexibacter antarcticus]